MVAIDVPKAKRKFGMIAHCCGTRCERAFTCGASCIGQLTESHFALVFGRIDSGLWIADVSGNHRHKEHH